MNGEFKRSGFDTGSTYELKTSASQTGNGAAGGGGCPEAGLWNGNPQSKSLANDDVISQSLYSAEPERGTWTGKLDFLLSCLGYAVGLGNVWRFPYLCYENGGGAFLVPYACMLLLVGLPIFCLELTLGQYGAMAPITLFKHLCPAFKGLGYAMFLAAGMVAIYYNMIIAWAIYYLFASFTSDLPWQHCGQDHNSDNCFNDVAYAQCKQLNNQTVYNLGRCFTNATEVAALNISDVSPHLRVSAPEEYLNRKVLDLSPGVGDLGDVQWGLALSLLLAWVVVFLCLIKGIKSSGKVVYFTATFPYLVLFILLIRGVTLPGAYEGIRFYMVPDWSKLAEVKVWKDAAVQIFYSLSIASGGLITLASYNKFHNNVVRDTLIVCFGNCLTSVFAGFAIFSILGFMAHELGVPVDKVVTEGPGLAFVAYPNVVTRLPAAPLWAILFFFMLFLLGLDSQFAIVENITTSLMDEFPFLRAKKTYVILTVSVIGYLLGLPLTTQGGRYILDLMDNYAAGWPYLFIGLSETVLIGYFYGINNYLSDIYEITTFQPKLWGKSHLVVMYMTVTPLILTLILLLSFISYEPLKIGSYVFPDWANAIGWIMALVPISLIPGLALYQLLWVHRNKPFKQRLLAITTTTGEWKKNALLVSKVGYEVTMNPAEGGVVNTVCIEGVLADEEFSYSGMELKKLSHPFTQPATVTDASDAGHERETSTLHKQPLSAATGNNTDSETYLTSGASHRHSEATHFVFPTQTTLDNKTQDSSLHSLPQSRQHVHHSVYTRPRSESAGSAPSCVSSSPASLCSPPPPLTPSAV